MIFSSLLKLLANINAFYFVFTEKHPIFALAIQKVLTVIAGWSSGSSLGS